MIEIVPDYDVKHIKEELIRLAKLSTCHRSKCGSVVTYDNMIIGRGFNSQPCNIEADCFKDKLAPTFKSDKTCCIHAEQRAMLDAIKNSPKLTHYGYIWFIRLDENDEPKHAGKPYCTICSKMALDFGFYRFVLWHKEGWTAYDTKTYNELSFQYSE